MGWSDGVTLAEDVWEVVRPFVPEEQRKAVARKLYDLFGEYDADGWDNGCRLAQDAEVLEDEDDDA